ncbi:MAG: hypothetical protein R3F48_03100 [Candidatus Zixiibacteriota bacterium]
MNTSWSLLVSILISIVIVTGSACAISGEIYDMSSSVRIGGMGEAGVAITDGGAAYYNPAQIGFPGIDYRISLTSSPGLYYYYETDDQTYRRSRNNISLILRPISVDVGENAVFTAGIGFEFMRDDTHMLTTTYAHPEGTGELFNYRQNLYRLSIGLGLRKFADFGVGFSVNGFKTPYYEDDRRYSLDIGVLIGLPYDKIYSENIAEGEQRINIYPSFGVSVQKLLMDRPTALMHEDFELTPAVRNGFAVKFSLDTKSGNDILSKFYLLPSYENWKNHYLTRGIYTTYSEAEEKTTAYGIEAGVYEALWLRAGHYEIKDNSRYDTYGASASLKGILCLIFGRDENRDQGFLDLFARRIDLRANYLNRSYEFKSYDGYHDGYDFDMYTIELRYYSF